MFMPPPGQVPYYGQMGLNAGVMLMDIQAMNQWQPGWTRTCLAVADRFKQDIKLADQVIMEIMSLKWLLYCIIQVLLVQDILNTLFHYYPDTLYELPCDWNYRMWQCNGPENTCGPAAETGVSLLHGCGKEFVKVPSPAAMFHTL